MHLGHRSIRFGTFGISLRLLLLVHAGACIFTLFRFASDVLPPKATMTLLAATLMLVTVRHGGIKALVRCGT